MTVSAYRRSQDLLGQFKLEEDLKHVEMQFGENPFKLDYANRILKFDDKKHPRAVKFEDVLNAELVIDERTTSGKSTTSVLGRAAIFGLLTGGAGAIVGAMTAKSQVKRDIRMVGISVTAPAYDPIDKPFTYKHTLYRPGFFRGYLPDQAIEVGTRVVKAILEATQPAPAATVHQPDVAQSLATLVDLHSKGLLSADEFVAAKAKLLAS